jgi:Ca-activated chloride channel family protein
MASIPTLTARPERHFIRSSGSATHVVYSVKASSHSASSQDRRPAITLALVIDRSGSMVGNKLDMAKEAALAVLDRLTEQDQVALVIYDNEIDTIQTRTLVSAELKRRIRSLLKEVQARGSTALHEGWLRGCDAIASEHAAQNNSLARCFLLTDGLANVGETDPERIASDALRVRREAMIGTSTFGIGADYDENLLGPMAVAGGGQFHHLRNGKDMMDAFTGELGDLFHVVARQVILEITTPPGVELSLIGAYTVEIVENSTYRVDVGDLIADDERDIIIEAKFAADHVNPSLHARIRWRDDAGEHQSSDVITSFTSVSDTEYEAEKPDKDVLRLFLQEMGERARRESLRLNKMGNYTSATEALDNALVGLTVMANEDPQIDSLIADLNQLKSEANAPINPMMAKAQYFRSQSSSRRQKDYRGNQE